MMLGGLEGWRGWMGHKGDMGAENGIRVAMGGVLVWFTEWRLGK